MLRVNEILANTILQDKVAGRKCNEEGQQDSG